MNIFKKLFTLVAVFAVSATMLSFLSTCNDDTTPYDVFNDNPHAQKNYILDETGNFVANIPYDEYLSDNATIDSSITVYDIRDYGAKTDADFKTNREAINNAIKDANKNGGGLVLVDGGEYTCANIELLSNVTLRIERNSALVNITYDQDKNENQEFNEWSRATAQNGMYYNALIYANNQENIAIEGPGMLKGNGATYCYPPEDDTLFAPMQTFNLKEYVLEHRKRIMFAKEHEMLRDFILDINYCTNVSVTNLHIYEAGSWTCRIECNENVLFEDVVIDNNIRVANTDGIDIMGGKNTTIRHCFIATGDDAICPKTDPYQTMGVEGLLVEDCELMSLANCFKTGTATHLDMTDITVQNCYFFMAEGITGGYAGIAIESTDGGDIGNITIKNIYMKNVTSPLLIWLGYRKQGQQSELHDITIEDITSVNTDIASAITGYPEANVSNVTLKNFNVKYREAQEKLDIYKGNSDYCGDANMGGYPEITRVSHMYLISHELSSYWDMSVYGLLVRYADNVVTENVNIIPRSTNTRPVSNITLG